MACGSRCFLASSEFQLPQCLLIIADQHSRFCRIRPRTPLHTLERGNAHFFRVHALPCTKGLALHTP